MSLDKVVKPALLVLYLLIWVAEKIAVPGAKTGPEKKQFVLNSLNEGMDKLLPNNVVGNWLQAVLLKAVDKLIDYLVGRINADAAFVQIDKVLDELFPKASGR